MIGIEVWGTKDRFKAQVHWDRKGSNPFITLLYSTPNFLPTLNIAAAVILILVYNKKIALITIKMYLELRKKLV
jgi:hypothetical protein